jgi:hypothetical protein
MILKDIINKSYYGTISYIHNKESLGILERYIKFNIDVLKEYKGIIVATNYGDIGLVIKNAQLWQKYFPKCIIIDLSENRGHNFGTADLDNVLFDYCKNNDIEWLCKTSSDLILKEQVLDIPIQESDFYYMNGIGFGGMVKYDFNNERIINEDFFPQTNFYFINVSKTDYLNDKKYIDKTYNEIQNTPNYNGKIWECFQGWECEGFLRECVNRNNLNKFHLLSKNKYIELLNIVKQEQIHDSSHKNIMIEGICHFHELENQIILL